MKEIGVKYGGVFYVDLFLIKDGFVLIYIDLLKVIVGIVVDGFDCK